MRFDDRLKTVLDSPVGDARDRAVRWRQLIDLLSRARSDADPALISRAIQVARDDRQSVPDGVRAATARSIAGRPLDPQLVSLFASDILEVAAPLLAGTTLDDTARREVAANASEEVRRFFFALEGPAARAAIEEPPQAAAAADDIPSIEEAVARIAQFTRDRAEAAADETPVEHQPQEPAPAEDEELLELTETLQAPAEGRAGESALFRWETDSLGWVSWVEGAPRAALVGRSLAGHPGESLLPEECRELVTRRSPFADLPLAATDPLEGEWRVSGAPAFAPGDGRFIGYRGLARRTDLTPSQRAVAPRAFEGADSLRELIHEIKTPLNAIVGFAQIIDGQYLGPAHRRYRERATEILGQAGRLLGAIDDLDFAAKVQSAKGRAGEGSDVATLLPTIVASVSDQANGGPPIMLKVRGRKLQTSLEASLCERLLRRFISTISEAASTEELVLDAGTVNGRVQLGLTRPAAVSGVAGEQLFDARAGEAEQQAMGVSLRLLRGLARIAGGDVTVDADRFVLSLPAPR